MARVRALLEAVGWRRACREPLDRSRVHRGRWDSGPAAGGLRSGQGFGGLGVDPALSPETPSLLGHPLASVHIAPGHVAGLSSKRTRGLRARVGQEITSLDGVCWESGAPESPGVGEASPSVGF